MILTDKEKAKYKEELNLLRDAYSNLLAAFHSTKHYSVSKLTHEALFSVNKAIKDLEQALED
jgi:hypothetical protein